MSEVNPNPRGWAAVNVFVDLATIAFATARSDQNNANYVTVGVVFAHDPSCTKHYLFRCTVDEWHTFRSALEIYRSNR